MLTSGRPNWRRFCTTAPASPSTSLAKQRADAALRRLGLIDENGKPIGFDRVADHTVAAADRLPFPHWQSSGVRCAYDPQANPFRHLFSNGEPLRRTDVRITPAAAEEIEQGSQPPEFEVPAEWNEEDRWRAQFFVQWRFWRRNASQRHAGFATFPADTRIPDHSIWTHMALVSAFAGAGATPALLKFQLGPVQDFIAAARSTRDLWSGSFLLSWLMAAGTARLAQHLGPDALIFPNLYGQPLFDLRFRGSLWSRIHAKDGSQNAWTSLGYSAGDFQTPNLPNVFLALVPSDRARELNEEVCNAIRGEWEAIASCVKAFAAPLFDLRRVEVAADARHRFDTQIARHLELAWQITPFSGDVAGLIESASALLPPDASGHKTAVERVRAVVDYFTCTMPREHRDPRYYVEDQDSARTKLNNLGVAWSLAVALNAWLLDAARQTRRFHGFSTVGALWNRHTPHATKDVLDGRNLMLFGGSEDWLLAVHELGRPWKHLFRYTDEVGAITLVKRIWHLAYLKDRWQLQPHGMPNTYALASGRRIESYDAKEDIADTPTTEEGKYYAVLAFDGDSIGQWISGAKTPVFRSQLAPHTHREGKLSPLAYLEANGGSDLLDRQRPLSPAYHLQFSEALSNFALECVPRIVHACAGRVIYAGGDDVLAMVPALHAIACADDLQRAFRGLSPTVECGIHALAPGFVSVQTDAEGRPIPLVLPGPSATASVGLALAHFKQPLQDVVRAALRAQKTAKRIDAGKHAVSLCLIKSSGEIVEWTTRFDPEPTTPDSDSTHRGGLAALLRLLDAMGCKVGAIRDHQGSVEPGNELPLLSAKFPHRLAELITVYISRDDASDLSDFPATEILARELDHTLARQRGGAWESTPKEQREKILNRLRDSMLRYVRSLKKLSASAQCKAVAGLLAAAAFLARQPHLETNR